MKPVRVPQLALLVGLVLTGCAQIANIEKRSYSADAGDDAGDSNADVDAGDRMVENPSSDECTDYCTRANTRCSADAGVSAFASDTYCQNVCEHFEKAADPKKAEGNTFECKLKELDLAERLTTDEISSNCQAIGSGGGDKCGSNCESYCQLYSALCSVVGSPDPDCLQNCPKLRDDPSFDSAGAFSSKSDTIQCRLAHLSAASVDPDPHCKHSAILLSAGPAQPCNPEVPSCEDYCGMLLNTCKDDALRQYDSAMDCINTCKKGFDLGKAPDTDGDTLACRHYHTYNAVFDATTHCPHTGPSGDGHCGKVCPAYCKLAQAACKDAFTQAFPGAGGRAACESDCADLTGKSEAQQLNLGYNVGMGKAGGNNIQCRLYYTSKAFTTASACVSALGGGDCK